MAELNFGWDDVTVTAAAPKSYLYRIRDSTCRFEQDRIAQAAERREVKINRGSVQSNGGRKKEGKASFSSMLTVNEKEHHYRSGWRDGKRLRTIQGEHKRKKKWGNSSGEGE